MNREEMFDEDHKYLSVTLTLPDGMPVKDHVVLLHSCCAPCSAAVIECMLRNGMRPTVYFSNPNIMPEEEYLIRKRETVRFLQEQNVPFVEDDYDHCSWLHEVKGMEHEPERGRRCSACFEYRMYRAARYAARNDFELLATTLASSRWKDIRQVNDAGRKAAAAFPTVTFWEQNWRRGGLQERRKQLLLKNNFYNQLYCGCEFSKAAMENRKEESAERNVK